MNAPAAESDPPVKKRSIDFKWIPIDLIVPNNWNINAQTQATFETLQDEIAAVGFIDPIEVVPTEEGTYLIIGGEHRWRAAKNLGYDELPCVLLIEDRWKEGDLQKFVSVRVNVLRGDVDPDKFVTFYNEMAEKYGAEAMQRLMAITDSKRFQKMVGWVTKGLKRVLPKDMGQAIDTAAKDVKSVEDIGNVIQDLFQKYGSTLAQSFMIFTYGKQSHVYISMNAKLRRAVMKITEACRVLSIDINDFVLPALSDAAKQAEAKLAAKPPSSEVAPKSEW
jgi:ParB-like nuclease family protein